MLRVLNAGPDPELVLLRGQVLRGAGFRVDSPANLEAAREYLQRASYDVLCLCGKTTHRGLVELASEFRERNPKGRVVLIVRSECQEIPLGCKPDGVVVGLAGPQSLLDTINWLTLAAISGSGSKRQSRLQLVPELARQTE